MVQITQTPPEPGILPARFSCIHYVQDSLIILWDRGDILNPKDTPQVWCYTEYTNVPDCDTALRRLRFLAGLLNGSREWHELATQA